MFSVSPGLRDGEESLGSLARFRFRDGAEERTGKDGDEEEENGAEDRFQEDEQSEEPRRSYEDDLPFRQLRPEGLGGLHRGIQEERLPPTIGPRGINIPQPTHITSM